MKRILILVALGLFLCSTARAQGGGGEPTKSKASPKKTSGTKSGTTTPGPVVPPTRPKGPTVARLMVNSNLPDATVSINGRTAGTTDSNGYLLLGSLKPGVYHVAITKPGYQPDKKVVNLRAGQSETLTYELTSITQALTVTSTPPECEIYIDGILRGRTDAAGNATVADVPVGDHRITIRKARYREANFPLSLSSDKEGQINVKLELAVGFLTVTTNTPNPSIDVSGVGHFTNPLRKFECQPGTYTITIASPLYLTSKKEVSISAGQEAQVSVDLEVDSAARHRVISEALEAYSRKQYDRAESLANTLLSVDPKHSQALSILAQSSFRQDDFNSFLKFGSQAIRAGGSLEFSLRHHHGFVGSSMHLVKLVLTSQTISFDPQVSTSRDCSYRSFRVSLQALGAVEQKYIGSLRTNAQHLYLRLVFVDPNNPKKTDTLNLYDREVNPQTYTNRPSEDPLPRANEAMSAIAILLNRAKAPVKRENESSMATNKSPGTIASLISLGRQRIAQKNFDGAIEVLTQAVKIQPPSAQAHYFLGEAYFQNKKGSQAVGYWNEAIRLDPVGMADAHLRLAILYNAAGMKDKAVAEYEQFLQKKPDYPEKQALLDYIAANKKP